MIRHCLISSVLMISMMGTACIDHSYHDYRQNFPVPDASPSTGPDAEPDGGADGGEVPDALPDALPDVQDAADEPLYRPTDPEGPVVVFLSPTENQVLAGDAVPVSATVSDSDGVDPASVQLYVLGGASTTMARAGTIQDQFSGVLEIDEVDTGDLLIIVEATDMLGHTNSAEVAVARDRGPVIDITTPQPESRYDLSVGVSFLVSDSFGLGPAPGAVEVEVDSVVVDIPCLQTDNLHGITPWWSLHGGMIDFDNPDFTAPLMGRHQMVISATNINGVSSAVAVPFIIDNLGPQIRIVHPEPGQVVGGVIEIEAEVEDESGVAPNSVVAVLAHDSDLYSVPLLWTSGAYRGSFDSQQFPTLGWYFPSVSVRAADLLQNENQVGVLVALDNQKPIVELDPPDVVATEIGESSPIGGGGGGVGSGSGNSGPFDPVGSATPSDAQRVAQIFFIRPRIEDPAVAGPGMTGSFASSIDETSPFVYILPGVDRALVVDTDGDGYCDEINPHLVPTTQPQTAQEVLALNLVPIPPTGAADYSVIDTSLDPPDPLCDGAGDMTVIISSTSNPDEPAIYSLPPVIPGDNLYCTGQQFDALANNIPEGWICVAVRVVDGVGNVGISPPLHLCIDYTLDGDPLCESSTVPDCTGTQDPVTFAVDATLPCQFGSAQRFPANEVVETP